ncbi:N-acetyltransferase [Loktanella sp. IMCC34160]|uniref:GNAT family N-acetyltransferase n=1 Tax=Loktanella sp. IMCC34160 TaxID=2510646 RepID=UPI00101C837F|nr:GNAT family N-acetyltransferase [Loktanella sp. IMCC34160]RYG92314.1 N-acetyltransferase [Loktanella sp. IMCC34160]
MQIIPLDSDHDWLRIEGLHRQYTAYICGDLAKTYGLEFDPVDLHEVSFGLGVKTRPPLGRSFGAFDDTGRACGMIMLRKAGPDRYEVKRLFVLPDGQGQGLGRRLVDAVIAEARSRGAKGICLDNTANLTTAISLYQRMGFTDCAPYEGSDVATMEALVPHGVYMDLRLD